MSWIRAFLKCINKAASLNVSGPLEARVWAHLWSVWCNVGGMSQKRKGIVGKKEWEKEKEEKKKPCKEAVGPAQGPRPHTHTHTPVLLINPYKITGRGLMCCTHKNKEITQHTQHKYTKTDVQNGCMQLLMPCQKAYKNKHVICYKWNISCF